MPLFPSKSRLAHIVFESDDKASKRFDVLLLVLILLSVMVVILDSVSEYHERYGKVLYAAEWFFTAAFTLEYVLRIWLSSKKFGYIFSFYGIVDLFAILPTYFSMFLFQSQYLTVVRALRFLRILRVLKLTAYVNEAKILTSALRQSRLKIQIFLGSILTIVLVMGSLMYIIEGPASGFSSIPRSMYWAIVTLTTVGYGDIAPQSSFGQFIASIIMLLGYAIIAVPTGIVTSELTAARTRSETVNRQKICHNCLLQEHDRDAKFCKACGMPLDG